MFMCFSSGDRYTAAKSCLYHLKNYGIPVWYDYHELILGDKKKEKNFEYAIKHNTYFIVIYSKNLFQSPCAIEEEKRIFNELNERNIFIFPILYNITFHDLPVEYQNKIENLIYNEINDQTGTLLSVNQIVTKFLVDKINKSPLDITPSLSEYDLSAIKEPYIYKLLQTYNSISRNNFNAQISMIYSLYLYLRENDLICNEALYLCKILEYLFTFTKLNIQYNHKEIIIAELSLILLLNEML